VIHDQTDWLQQADGLPCDIEAIVDHQFDLHNQLN
jgi:hypothetical protein